jgi:hypothetical protein
MDRPPTLLGQLKHLLLGGPKSPFFVLTVKFDFALYRKTYGETTDKTYAT